MPKENSEEEPLRRELTTPQSALRLTAPLTRGALLASSCQSAMPVLSLPQSRAGARQPPRQRGLFPTSPCQGTAPKRRAWRIKRGSRRGSGGVSSATGSASLVFPSRGRLFLASPCQGRWLSEAKPEGESYRTQPARPQALRQRTLCALRRAGNLFFCAKQKNQKKA